MSVVTALTASGQAEYPSAVTVNLTISILATSASWKVGAAVGKLMGNKANYGGNYMRLIDADKIRNEWLYNGSSKRIYNTNDFLDSIDKQPTEALEEPKAYWFMPVPGDGEPYCTRCRKPPMYDYAYGIIGGWKLTQYCYNCGAKMYEGA